MIGADTVSNLRPDFVLVEAILSVLVEAGVPEERLCETYNAVQAALVGFVTQELARMPTEDLPSWQSVIQANLAEADAARYPHLVRLLPRLMNRAFILRWQNGAAAPMGSSFEVFVDCIIMGLRRHFLLHSHELLLSGTPSKECADLRQVDTSKNLLLRCAGGPDRHLRQ
ncbi:TetR/AcrR family transcriptional regulator C-terminal domain-containing protein [Pseudoroseomonas wenyumeiae]